MAESCVMRLCGADDAEWVIVDSGGARVGGVERGTLAEAPPFVGSRRLVLLVPGTDVVLAEPELPARGAAKLLQLVPFALEENLAADVDSLHFAVGRVGADKRVPVAAVDRTRFAGWLSAVRAVGLTPAAVYTDALVVPANPSHVVVVLDGSRVLVRRPGALPVALEADPFDAALFVAGLPPADAAVAAATHLIVYASPADWDTHRAEVEALRARIGSLKVQLLPDGPLALLAATAINEPPFTLLQGDFASSESFAAGWSRWRLAATLAGAFLVLHLATLGVDWWRLSREERAVDQSLRRAAAEAMPGLGDPARLPNVRAAIDSRLNASRAAVEGGLVGTLGALASATVQAPGTRVQSLSYRDGSTDLVLDAPDVSAVDRVQQLVTANGFSAQMQGASQREQRYEARLQIKGPRS